MSKTDENTFRLKRQILRLFLAFLVVTLVLVTPFNALANADNAIDSGVSSLNYKYLKNSIAGFFQIFGITTPLHAVNSSNDSELNNVTQNTTITINTASQHVPNAAGKVVDKEGNPVVCEISIRSSDGIVKKQGNKATQYDSPVVNSDVITFDATKSKNVSAKFKLQTGSDNGNVVLDNFGKVKPTNVKKPDFSPLKYVEIHAENVSYDTVEITVSYTDEELAGFEEDKLVLYHYTNGNWVSLKTTVDPVGNTITASVGSLSVFAIGQGSGINVYSQIDEHVNPNTTVTISGAIYYDNLTAVDGASIDINVKDTAISRNAISDSNGNFQTSFQAPSSTGNYEVMVNASFTSMTVNSTETLEVTNSSLFKLSGEITVTNQDVVAPGSNVTLEYGVPAGSVAGNSTITITGKTSVADNKTYHVYTDTKVDWENNASGTYTFIIDSLAEGEVNITGGSIITNALSYTGFIGATENYDTYLDSATVGSSHAVKPWDHDTWYWLNTIPLEDIKYNQSQTIDTVTTSSTTLVRFNLTSDVKIGFTVSGLNLPTNASFYVDNIKLISTSGNLGSVSANMTGYMNDTTNLIITSDTKGGIEYTTFTSFHDYLNATSVKVGPNYTATLSFTNDDINDWENITLHYDVPQGSYNVLVTDTDNNNFNETSNCTIPSDGGDVVIPPSLVGTIHSGSSRTFTVKYSLKQLNVTTVTDKHTYAPGQSIQINTSVLYDDSPISDAVVWVQVEDPDDVLVINEQANWDSSNYSLIKATNETWKVGIYHVTVNATKTVDGVERTGNYTTSFAEKKIIMYVQGNGPYLQCCNITIDGRAYYSDNTAASGEVVNITVGSTNTSAVANATGYYNVAISGFEPGTYDVNATVTDALGLTDTDNDAITVLDEPFFILVDSELTEMSGQVLMSPNHTFSIDVPSGVDVLSSTINLTGITEKTTDFDISPPPMAMVPIGTTQFNYVNGTLEVEVSPYNSLQINDVNLTVTAFSQNLDSLNESSFNTTIDDTEVGDSQYVTASDVSTTWYVDVTSRVSPATAHELRIYKLDTFAVDYQFLVMAHVNQTGFLDTPVNPRAYIDGNIIYAESGDMLTSSHATDITKFMDAGSNSLDFVNDRNALVNYEIQLKVRDWNYTQETVNEPTDMFEIESIIYAAATDQKYNNPEIRHMLKKFASNLTVFDLDNTIDITSNCTVSDNELYIPANIIGAIDAGNVRLFNVSYDAPRPNISPSINRSQYNRNDTVQISADITFHGSQMTDANVSATITNLTDTIWQGYMSHVGSGTYTTTYTIPTNTTLGYYNVSVIAFNDSTNRDDEVVQYELRELNITPHVTGPFIANHGGTISGNVADVRTGVDINGATVNITITNQSGIVNQSGVSSDANGNFSFIWDSQMAGDYNLSIRTNDSNMIFGTLNRSITVEYDVSLDLSTDYNAGYNIPINVSIQDLGNVNVSGANVSVDIEIPGEGIEILSTNNSRLTYIGGTYSGNFTNTTVMGTYNVSVTAGTSTSIGGLNSSFRVSNLSIRKFTNKMEYLVDENVSVYGNVRDLEVDQYILNGTYNISIFNSTGFVVSKEGNISPYLYTKDAIFYDEDVFEVAGDDWNSRNYEDPVRDSSTSYLGTYSLHMTWPGTTKWGGRNFEDANNLETGQTSAGYSTTDYPYMSMAYRISDDDTVNIVIKVNGAWKSLDVTQGINTGGSFPTVANWGTLTTDDQWYLTEINLDDQLDTSLGTGNHQITAVIWYPNTAITSYLTGDFWIDDFRISNNSILESFRENFSDLPAESYSAVIDVSYLTIVGSNSTDFVIDYNVTTSIPYSLYSVGQDVDINISLFDVGSVPVTGANLTVNVTNSTGLVTTFAGSNITDNANGYYNTTFVPAWEDDFNISVHVEHGVPEGDATLVPFRVTTFAVDTTSNATLYEAGDSVTVSGNLWDSQGSPRWANVTLQVHDSEGTEIQNTTLSNRFDEYNHSFILNASAPAGVYSIQVNASELDSGGNLVASNTSTFNVEYIVTSNTNHSQYNTNDDVNVTLNIKNGTSDFNGADVDVNVTYMGISDWWDFDWDHRVKINVTSQYSTTKNGTFVLIRGSNLSSAGVSLSNLPINSTRITDLAGTEIVRTVIDENSDGYFNTTDEIVFSENFTSNQTRYFWIYYDHDVVTSPAYSIPSELKLYAAEEFIITGDRYARVYYKHSNRNGTFGSSVIIDDNSNYDWGAAIADFDNDGDYDVVVGDSTGNLYLHKWTGVGTFSKSSISSTFTASGFCMDMATADFDEDGNMDFVVGGNNDDLFLYEGNGIGGFTKSTITTNAPGTSGRGKDAGDVNEDGDMDFIYAENPGGHIYAYYGNGDGTFTAPVDLLNTGGSSNNPYGSALGDFDNDGHLDIISNGGTSGDYHVYSGDGTGTFTDEGLKFDSGRHGGADAFDYDHDGNLDIVHTTYDTEYTYYRAGNGDFTFGSLSLGTAGNNLMGISAPPIMETIPSSALIVQSLNKTPVWNGSASSIGNGNYSGTFSLSNADIGIYLVETNVTSPWQGDDDITFVVRSLNTTNYIYGPYNFNGTHNTTILPLIFSGTVKDSEFNTSVNNSYANITITYPNGTTAAYQSVTTDVNGIYHYNFTSNFSSISPAGVHNVSILINDGGILNLFESNFTVLSVHDSWADPAKDYRVGLLLNNTNNHSSVTYTDKGFVLDLLGSVDQDSIAITDISGNDIGYSSVWDDANTINVTLDAFSLGMFEGKLIYVYFERDAQTSPDTISLTNSTLPIIEGAVEGYTMIISKDEPLYASGTTAQIFANLTLADGSSLTGSVVNFSVFYPNSTLACGPHNSSDDPSNISVSTNSYALNYSIPNLKGVYTVVVNATSPTGIPRSESSTFNVGGLTVAVDTDSDLYNIRDDVWFTINVTDAGTPVENAIVKVDVNDPTGLLPYEYTHTWTTDSNGTALFNWPKIEGSSIAGDYSITVNANTANDSGYSGSQTIRIERYVTTLDLTESLVSLDHPVTASGSTTHNSTAVSSWVNVTVVYQDAFIDDAVPYGATAGGTWDWDYNNVHSGSYSHIGEASGPATSQHYFVNAYSGYHVGTGENISIWVYMDPLCEIADEIMVQFYANDSWEHRAYWGADNIQLGTNNTTSRYPKGTLPSSGVWSELTLNSTEVGLDGLVIEGMSFVLNETSSNLARVWFDDARFENAPTHSSYLDNQNVSSTPYTYSISNTFTETFNDTFDTFNSTEWINTSDSYLNTSAGWMVLNGTGINWNGNFSGNTAYLRSSHPVFKVDFMTSNLSGGLVVASEGGEDLPSTNYRRHGIYIDTSDSKLKAQKYNLDGWEYTELFTPEIDTWYTMEIRFYDTESQLFVYSRDNNSRPRPNTADSIYNLTDWNPNFHFWTYDHEGYIDNAVVSTQSSYDVLPWVGDYIVTSVSGYSNLSTTNVSTLLVADLNVTVNTGDSYLHTIGNLILNNVTINGTVQDNRSGVYRQGDVLVYVTAPDNTISIYNLTADVNGSFSVNFTRPSLSGTYNVTVTAEDAMGITGRTDTSFEIQFGSTVAPMRESINLMDTATLTVELFNNIVFDDMELTTSNWSYRTGTVGTLRNMATLYHKSGSKSQKVDYYLNKGVNEYMFLESGLGAVDVDEYTNITFWLYLEQPDAFDSVALVLENDPTGMSTNETVYGQNPVPGWNYYSFNVNDLGMDLSHDHYLTILIDDDNGADEVKDGGSLYIDDLKLIKCPITGAVVTINITKPDTTVVNYSTSTNIIDNLNGTYSLNFTGTDESGNYTVTATSTKNGYTSTATTQFVVDSLSVSTVVIDTPYIVDDSGNISITVNSNNRSMPFDGTVYLNLTLPNGTSIYSNTSSFIQSQNYASSGTAGGSGFSSVSRINDGIFTYYTSTDTCVGDYIQITWASPVTINQVMTRYDSNKWPTEYKIQVLDTDGVTWIDKKSIDGYVSATNFPDIIDDIPTTTTKGVRIYYEASYNADNIYIFEMWAYNTAASLTPSLALSGNYTANITAIDSTGVQGTAIFDIPVNFKVSNVFDRPSCDPGDNATVSIQVYNGTGLEPTASITSQLIYVSNGSVINTSEIITSSNGTASIVYQMPQDYSSYYVNSTVSKDGTIGFDSNITSTANLRMWANPAEALVGHSTWPVNVAPTNRRDLMIYTELMDRAGHTISDMTVNASIYRYDGVLLENITLTNDDGLYSGNYTVAGNGPEGQYWFELEDYPGVKQYFSVVEWGCTRCHIDVGMTLDHYYSHSISSGAYGASDGPIYPSNFSKEYVHEMHPLVDSSPWGIGVSCNNHGYHSSGAADQNCVKCHPTEVLPSACPDCHNSANNRWSDILSDDYGADVHAGINRDVALGKSATSSNGGYPTRAVDNDEKTAWVPDDVANQLLEVNLGGFYIIDGVRIAMSNYKATYSMEGWDGSSWISLVSSTTYTNYGNDKNYSFTQKNVSKVRLTVSAWNKASSGSTCWGGTGAATVPQQPEVKSINVYMPNDLPVTAANPTSHIVCQACHGGDVPNDVQPTIPECTDCHPESSGSEMQVMPSNTSIVTRQLEDYEDVSDVNAYSATGFPVSTVTFTDSADYAVEGNKSGKLDYDMAVGVGRIYVNHSNLDFTNATSIKFWLYGNPSDNDTQFQVSIRNSKSGLWHYNTAQNLNWAGWRLVEIPISSLSQVDILYITHADALRIRLESTNSDSGTIYIDDLHVERKGTHTLYQETECGVCHNAGHNLEPSPQCQYCHQTQTHGNTTASQSKCVECHHMENGYLIVRNIDSGNDTTLVEIPMDGAKISECSICHDRTEPHDKQWRYVCMDCHRDSQHGAVDPSYSDYEKASTCLKCHNEAHDLSSELASASGCNGCHQQRVHGQSSLTTVYDESIHLDCMRCHGNPINDSEPLPGGLGHSGEIHINTSIGLESDQCMICHGNATFSYELHVGQTVDQSNTTLLNSILNESICVDCHDPVPSFKNTSVYARDELPLEPHAIVVAGHGNVSCFVCHGHKPAKLTLDSGSDCVGCHMSTSINVELINNSIPKNNKTVIVDNSSTILVVTSPQVLGHGNTDCGECHGHANSELTYVGSSETECMECHENGSTTTTLLENTEPKSNGTVKITESNNVWTVTPPQVLGHGNVTCIECHDHAPSDFENASGFLGLDCLACHMDPLRNVTLANNTIPKNNKSVVVDNTSSHWIVSSPQVLGHGNASCAACHGHSNADLTFVGSNDSSCMDCHENSASEVELLLDSDPMSTLTVIVNSTVNPMIVTPPQVDGHGNVSCAACHEHAPSDYTNDTAYSLIGGNCSSCHKDVNKTTYLINGTIPKNTNTNWTNSPIDTPPIVIGPQISGHGRTNEVECIVCHGHTNSILSTPDECKECHTNQTRFDELNVTPKFYEPPQIYGHGNTSCAECHNHDTPNLTFLGETEDECLECHINSSTDNFNNTWNLLNNTEPRAPNTVVVNNSSSMWIVNPPQVAKHGNTSCIYCHSHAPSDYDINTVTTTGTNCMICHVNSSAPIVPLNNNMIPDSLLTNWTNSPNKTSAMVIAPQIVPHGDTNHDSVSNSTDCYICHGHDKPNLIQISDCNNCHTDKENDHPEIGSIYVSREICMGCHGSMHSITAGGGPNCMLSTCHGAAYKSVNASLFNDSVHINLNSGANNSSVLTYDFEKACWLCHGDGTEPNSSTHLTNLTAVKTCYDAIFCHGNTSLSVGVSEHFRSGDNITVFGSLVNDTESCLACHNLTAMKVSGTPTNNTTALYSVSHYGKNYTTISVLRDNVNSTDYCLACHGNTNSIFYNASIITKTTTHGNNCSSCHGAGNIHDSELSSYAGEGISDCLDCHSNTGNNKYINSTIFTQSVHVNLNSEATNSTVLICNSSKACWSCHGNGTQPTTHLTNLTEVRTCYDNVYCHGNTTLNQNVSVQEHFINGTDIQATNATDNVSSCIQCHNLTDMKVTGAPTDKNGTHLVSHYAKNYTTVSQFRNNINSTDYCLACHGNTYSIFYNASIITKTTTHGNNCSSCHGGGNIHDDKLSSYAGKGISDCLDCHSNIGSNKYINSSLFTQSVHVNLNSDATNTTILNYDSSKACWLCHGNGTQPTTHLTNLTEVRTCYETVYCHGNTTLNVGVSEHFLSGENIKALTGEANNTESCIACHNLTDMKVTGTPTTGIGLYSVSHFAKNYTTISSLISTTNTTDYCTSCHFNDTSIFKPFIDTSGEHGTDCAQCHGIGRIHDASLEVPLMTGDSSECLGCHDGLTNKSVTSSEYIVSVHAPVNCVDCHTPRQEFKGIIVNQESLTYNFTMTPNVTSLNATLVWEGDSTLGLTLHSPNGTNYSGNSINISSPQEGNWSAVIQDIIGDAPFTVMINVTMDHGILMAKDCEDCHITGFSTTPIVYKHVPQQSNVPTDASCILCHESKLSSATAMGSSHYAPRVTLDTKDCIQCHNGSVDDWGNAPDQRNHTDFAFVTKTLSVDKPWELVDNYTITLIETTTNVAMFDIRKDSVLLEREVVGLGDNIKYEVSGLGIDDIAIINVTVDQLFTAEDSYVVDLSGYMLSSHIHRETQNEECYSCHDNEYRNNMPDGMNYYVLDKNTENVTLMEMPVNFTDGDKKTLAMGDSWDLGEGFSVYVVDVSIERSNARLQLYGNETLLEDTIVSKGSYITHEERVFGREIDREIDIFSAKVDSVFVGNAKFVVLTNVDLIAGDQKIIDGDTPLLHSNTFAKYLTLDGGINVGEEPENFHAATITPGGYSPDCISCHAGNGVAPIKLNLDEFKEGVHVNLNNDTTYTSFITDDANKACWGCHGNSTGGEPDEHPTSYLGNHTPKSCMTCHATSQFGAKPIYSHYPGAEISTSGTCWDCHSNKQNNSKPQNAVASASHYSAKKKLLNTSDCAVCHGDETNATLWGNAPQVSKHNSSNDCALCHAGEGITTFHDKGITITRDCETCHVDKQQAEKFNLTPILTHYPGAPDGKANTLEINDYTCRVCHNATNNTLHSGMEVREYQNESMGFCFPCHSTDGKFPHKSDTQLEEVLHGSGIKVVVGCDSCHAAEGVSKYHTPTALGKGYMRGTVKYDTECTECHPEHEGREYQPYEGILCTDCHNEYGSVHYAGLKIGQSNATTSTCPLCHNEEADIFHELTHIVGNVSEEAYEPCGDCHDDTAALMEFSSSASIIGGTMSTISQPALDGSPITCTSCHNSSGMNSFHYDVYPMGTVQDPGWGNWTAGNVTKCKDCHTYQGGEPPFNATNMGTEGRSPAGTAHGFAPSCTICHGGADPISFHILATSEFIPRLGVTIEPNVVSGGDISLLQATVVLPPLTKLTRAEYFIDEMGRDGYGLPLGYIVGESNDSSAVLGAVIETSELSYGKHPIFVHVKDSSGKWSKTEVVVLTVERPGGVAATEVFLKDIIPAFGFAGLLFLLWRRFR